MAIRNKGNLSELKARMNAVKVRIDRAIFFRLSFIGEKLVNYARSITADIGYTDQTGNLRSSTGYIIVKDGIVLKSDFDEIQGPVASIIDGKSVGLNHAISIALKHPVGYVLIVVAGMDYAFAVESRGKDVLTTTEYLANEEIPKELRKLREQIKRMKL
ncbi:MAG: hypothetical protein KG029_18900 [Bacteroidetes bacterium]|nr:hypothetical protein [Bacteroidota bacterium]